MGELTRGVEGNDLRGAREGGIRDNRRGIGSMWGDNTCWTATPITALRSPQLLRLGPGQCACPWNIPHVHNCIVNLELSNLPLRSGLPL